MKLVFGREKAVKVCEVDVMEEDVLPVTAILARWLFRTQNFRSRSIFFCRFLIDLAILNDD